MYQYDLPCLHSDWQSVKYILIVKDKLTTDIKLKTWRSMEAEYGKN